MKIIRRAVEQEGSCSFCQRGSPKTSGTVPIFPYDEITQISRTTNGGIIVNICDDCLATLKKYA